MRLLNGLSETGGEDCRYLRILHSKCLINVKVSAIL
ncbi:MAG: hypothetical protein ACI845_002852 [Gammaproteobacteria bacterium]